MIKKLSDFIVNKRKLVLTFMLVLAVVSAVCSLFVNINEDMTKYLPDDSNMKAGIDIMAEEFPEIETSNSIRVMFDDLTDSQKQTVFEELSAIKYVDSVDYDAEISDYNKDNHTLYVLTISCDYGSDEEAAIESALEAQFADYTVVWQNDDTGFPHIPTILIVTALAVLLAILLVMCGSWIEPLLFLVVIGVAVVINSGTNLIMGSVASITNSISAILQLVLSMDYSIILMNRYRQEKEQEPDSKQAMKNALTYSFSSVSSSSLTTVIGLIMLVFMSFKIGANLGIVLAKGVFISMVCVLTMLPGIILACDKLIKKTAKKSLHIPTNWAAKFSYKMRYVMMGLFVVLFVVSYILQQQTGIAYTLAEEDVIADIFPKDNTVVMVYENQDEDKINELVADLEKDENIKSVMGYSNILGKSYTSSELAGQLGNMSEDISLNSSVIDILYYDYHNNGETGTMTAVEFLSFISDKVMNDETFSEYISDDVKENVDMLNKFADAKALKTPMTADRLAEFFDIDADTVKLLFVYYYAMSDSYDPGTMTIPEFVDYLQNNIADDPAFSSYLDESTMEQIKTLASFTDKTSVQTQRNTAELASILGIEENLVKTIFIFHNSQNDSDSSTTAAQNSETGSDMIEIVSRLISGRDISNKTMSVEEVVDFVLADSVMNNYMDDESIEQMQMVQKIIKASVNNTEFTCSQLSDLLGMDGSMLKMLYTVKAYERESNNWRLSVKGFIDFILDDVLSDNAFADKIDADTSTMLYSARTIVNAVISGKAYTASEMGELLGGLTEELNSSMIGLMYLYAESSENSDPEWSMPLETLFGYMTESVLYDSRFESVIDEDMRQKLLEAQVTLDEGKNQLVTDKYSRLIITSSYPDEGEETNAFFANLEQYGNDNLNGKYYLVGNSAMNYEMQKTFDNELLFITLLTALAIFIIIALTFKSLSIPLILVLLVQCGVYITITITGYTSGSIYYLALLIVECILMGATVDYGILFTNYYCDARKTANVIDSLKMAYAGSIHTIMTSGLILVLVTAVVGGMFENATVTAIVKTISMGALCATILILFVLPGVLATCDKIVTKKRNRH